MLKHTCTCNDCHCTRKNNPISTVHWPTNQSSPERPVPKYGDFGGGARRRDGSMDNPTTRRIWTCAGGLALAARKASGASTACKATDKLTTTAWGGRKGKRKEKRNKPTKKQAASNPSEAAEFQAVQQSRPEQCAQRSGGVGVGAGRDATSAPPTDGQQHQARHHHYQ